MTDLQNRRGHTKKGDEKMKKRSLLLITVLMVALLFVSSPAIAAQPSASGTIECVLDITYDDYGDGVYWYGTVTGSECSVEGTIRIDAVPAEYFDAGKTLHFAEEFTIWPDSGGAIKGKDWGVWNLSTFKYRANGWVREASDEWAHLVGSHYHGMGVTGNPDDGLPITAPGGWMKIAPSNRPSDALP
jgi:hypothetical protein